MTDLAAIAQKLAGRPIVTRFAPSPTGFLHLGHVAHALYVWAVARALKAKVLLRIEDHDAQRCKPSYTAAILRDLQRLGFIPDGGFPARTSEHAFIQSENTARYEALLAELQAQGHVYPCACSRKDLQRRQGPPLSSNQAERAYDGFCRGLNTDPSLAARGRFCWRLHVPSDWQACFWDARFGWCEQRPALQCGDFALKDAQGNPTYQMAVVVDDLHHGVNLVIRGEDLLASTGRQLYLRQLLAPTAPAPLYVHHPLLCEPRSQEKLSKSKAAESVASLLQQGYTPSELIKEAARRLGWPSEGCLPS